MDGPKVRRSKPAQDPSQAPLAGSRRSNRKAIDDYVTGAPRKVVCNPASGADYHVGRERSCVPIDAGECLRPPKGKRPLAEPPLKSGSADAVISSGREISSRHRGRWSRRHWSLRPAEPAGHASAPGPARCARRLQPPTRSAGRSCRRMPSVRRPRCPRQPARRRQPNRGARPALTSGPWGSSRPPRGRPCRPIRRGHSRPARPDSPRSNRPAQPRLRTRPAATTTTCTRRGAPVTPTLGPPHPYGHRRTRPRTPHPPKRHP